MDLNTTWFLLVGVLIIGYAILDGFDLGVGVLHLFTKDENEKRIEMNKALAKRVEEETHDQLKGTTAIHANTEKIIFHRGHYSFAIEYHLTTFLESLHVELQKLGINWKE